MDDPLSMSKLQNYTRNGHNGAGFDKRPENNLPSLWLAPGYDFRGVFRGICLEVLNTKN